MPAETPAVREPGELQESSPGSCTNCGRTLRDDARFCDRCSEPRASVQDYSFRGVLQLFELSITNVDSKFWRSIVLLFTRPGELTRQFFAGRRTSYAKPLTLFVMLNLVFFLVQPHTGLLRYDLGTYTEVERDARGRVAAISPADDGRPARMARDAMAGRRDTPGEFAVRFDAELQSQKQGMLIFMIPLFALALLVLRRLTGASSGLYLQHLVFSIHTFAFFLVVMVLVTPVFTGLARLLHAMRALVGERVLVAVSRAFTTELTLVLVLMAVISAYLFAALRRVYGDPRWRAAILAPSMFLVLGVLIRLYRSVLFYLALVAL